MESKKPKLETSSDSLTDGQLTDADDSQSPISKLLDECLIHIFSLLPIRDRVRIQRVCKHWRTVSLKSWSSLKTLGFQEEDWGYKYWLSRRGMVDHFVLKEVLKLCGRYVTRIDFSKYYIGDNLDLTFLMANERFFVMIKKLCPNLTAFDIRGLKITDEGLEFLQNNFTNLTEFAINQFVDLVPCFEYRYEFINFNKPLSLLFKNNKNLRRVILHVPSDGNCLLNLNPIAIEDISVMHNWIRKETTCRALEKFLNLHSLNIILDHNNLPHEENDLIYINEMLMAIKPHSENLKELDINIIDVSPSNFQMIFLSFPILIDSENFKCCSNLQKISLEGHKIYINFNIITNYCTKLTCVKLIDLLVPDFDMASIMQLPELQELYLWCLDKITDAIFINRMCSLKILDCYKCLQLTNVGFRKFIRNSSENLQRLTVTECRNVDLDNLIQDVKKETDTRSTRSLLKMFVNYKAESILKKERASMLSNNVSFMNVQAKRKVTWLSKYLELIEYTYL